MVAYGQDLIAQGIRFANQVVYSVIHEAGGIAQALGLAEQFVGSDQSVVILGDNVFEEDISQYIESFAVQGNGAKIFIKKDIDPQRIGVPQLRNDKIITIEEKPTLPMTEYAVTGIYMFNSNVFDIIKKLTPSNRGELEITDVNNAYIRTNELTYHILHGWWTDAGTHSSLAKANELAKDILFDEHFGELKL
ncbi:MAG: dTDP-glucose pyrophosphorylase [Gorillibacterium sp.]|nr:dTDP-glucose pyrophosphorylase [Gorillibacterium sp.]